MSEVVLSRLNDAKRERFMDFLLENNIQVRSSPPRAPCRERPIGTHRSWVVGRPVQCPAAALRLRSPRTYRTRAPDSHTRPPRFRPPPTPALQFSKEGDHYIATIQFTPQMDESDDTQSEAYSEEGPGETKNYSSQRREAQRLTMGRTPPIYGRRGSRPPQEMARVVGAIATSTSLFDYSCYPKFSSLVTMREELKPKQRPVAVRFYL